MVANTSLTRRVLGGVVGVNLALALAVSAGAVPRPGDNVQAAASTQVEELAAPAARQAGDAAAPAAPAPAAADPTPTTAAPTTTVAKPKVTTPPTTKAPRAAAPKTTTAPAVAAAPAAPAPVVATVTQVARRVPTAAEVQAVITRLKKDIPLLTYVSISPAQIDQAGNQICSAFDSGQTFAQVKATGLSMIPSSIKVPAATADYAVRQAVTLYCPGHANKLV